ncbi:type II secretion system protein GspM [Maricaulis sp. D1M11]|uniref:type II secretion system protein GspM n=1 Tax=Maricaulis sp. D1M11 TaxID=3076117 RepID=UPI0039B6865C
MNRFLTPLLQAWGDRSPREQIMLGVMGLLAFVILGQMLIVHPLLNAHARAEGNYAAAMRMFRGIEADIATLRDLRQENGPTATDQRPLRTVVGGLALGHQIPIARLVPSDNGQLTVNITRAETRRLMQWLVELDANHDIEVVTSTIDRLDDLHVEAYLVLQRRGGQ